jgi:hypothetical protein
MRDLLTQDVDSRYTQVGNYYISELLMRKYDRNMGTVIFGFRQKRIEPEGNWDSNY